MIKHPRNVMDAVRAFDNAKKKIVVLCAIKLGTESAHLPHELAPDQGEVADVVAGKKIVRRPIGFEDRGVETLLGQFVFVGVDEICVGMILQPFHVLKERIWFEDIIVIEKGHPIALRHRKPVVGGG